jgi:hypothetical protein
MRTLTDLEPYLDHIRASPRELGSLELVVRRPAVGEREVVDIAELDPERGMIGDNWHVRPSKRTPDRSPNREQQLTLMSIRAIAAITEPAQYALAGDQLFVDLDLSEDNLPAGTRLELGEVLLEVSAVPHAGCDKFTARFGSDATKWVNNGVGRELRLRGINAKIVRGGVVRRGDTVRVVR